MNANGSVYDGVVYQDMSLSLVQSHPFGVPIWNISIQQDGEGTQKYSNGDFYTGSFINGVQNGKGNLLYSNGITTDGMWVNGKLHGDHIETHPNGDKYLATYANGKFIKKSIVFDL